MQSALDRRQDLYEHLMAHRQGFANDPALARMLASQRCGIGALPARLGLDAADFEHLLARHFPHAQWPAAAGPAPRLDLRLLEEAEELHKLMRLYRAGVDASEVWIGRIVATGCMAGDHLWQDLGLGSRQDLSALLARNFPGLAAKNDRNMRWKKFLYKQLCIQEGIYICRAPSCELCSDYRHCFGPQE